MQPEESLQLAKRLLDDPSAPESHCRAVAHIAYYSVYHLVCAHFGIDPGKNYSESNHADVRRRLRAVDPRRVPPEIREAKRVFERLWKLRVSADYEWDKIFSSEDAEDAFEWANGVFARIQPIGLNKTGSSA